MKGLKFEEAPDYELLRKLFKDQLKKEEAKSKIIFDWTEKFIKDSNGNRKVSSENSDDEIPDELWKAKEIPKIIETGNRCKIMLIIVNLVPCSRIDLKEEEKCGIKKNNKPKSTFALISIKNEENAPLINPSNLMSMLDLMEIPKEMDDPLILPYVSSMSPQNKRRESMLVSPSKLLSTTALPQAQLNFK